MHVTVKLFYKNPHISQILTGFLLLQREKKIDLEITKAPKADVPFHALVEAQVSGKTIAFDTMDGYNFDLKAAEEYINKVDFYFKRSYSDSKNQAFSTQAQKKIHPLGFNYHVTCPGNPCDDRGVVEYGKEMLNKLRGKQPRRYFTADKFEKRADYKKDNLSILFFTRLWEADTGNKNWDMERAEINRSRVEILRELLRMYPNNCRGGVFRSPAAQELCPDLIVDGTYTNRNRYLPLMQASDICIGTMGLHESIGWKNAEYIAAARAVVSEKFHYRVPGDFAEGKNYLPFSRKEDCIKQVRYLMENPAAVYEMKQANEAYYQSYLRPDRLVWNALNVVKNN